MSERAPIPLLSVTRLRSAVTRKTTPVIRSYVVTGLRHLYTHVRVQAGACVCAGAHMCVRECV